MISTDMLVLKETEERPETADKTPEEPLNEHRKEIPERTATISLKASAG